MWTSYVLDMEISTIMLPKIITTIKTMNVGVCYVSILWKVFLESLMVEN